MRLYKAQYAPEIGKWMVLNTETKKYHSRWSNQKEAFLAASDLNKIIDKMSFSKKSVALMNSSTQKPHLNNRI